MGAESRAEAGEPQIARGRRRMAKMFLENEKNRGTAHVAMGLEDRAAGGERIPRQRSAKGVEHIAPPGVDEDGSRRRGAFFSKKRGDRGRCVLGDGAIEQVAQLAIAGLEAQPVALFRQVERMEPM